VFGYMGFSFAERRIIRNKK